MSITGVQLLDRFQNEVRFLITPRVGVDSFSFSQSTTSGGAYADFASIINVPNLTFPYKGKILLQFNCSSWDNTVVNYVKVTPVVGGVPGASEGPLVVPPIRDIIVDKSVNIIGYNADEKRFINVSVNTSGEVITA
jgi:hypothetical protein